MAGLGALGRGATVWWWEGHHMVGEAAARALPSSMPRFFRSAVDELAYLNAEPDRWRDAAEVARDPAMNEAQALDHKVALERLPAGALAAPNRYAYLDSCARAGVSASDAGLLPFQILELTQRLRIGFGLWRRATTRAERTHIEHRIIQDAGILGHYVADGSQPHHTSVRYGDPAGGPQPSFHARFEDLYVRERITLAQVRDSMLAAPQAFEALRPAIIAYLRRTHSLVDTLFALDAAGSFGPQNTAPGHHAFAVARLAAGATMLRDLWWTAWVTSGEPD